MPPAESPDSRRGKESAEDKKMKVRDLVATLLCITLTLGLSQAVHADPNRPGPPDPEIDCQTLIFHTLIGPQEHICIAELLTVFNTIGNASDDDVNPRDKSRLQSKACAADDKLEVTPVPKFADAHKKLDDLIQTVANKAKIVDVENKITDAALAAKACIPSG
jgi:hypothetical protein